MQPKLHLRRFSCDKNRKNVVITQIFWQELRELDDKDAVVPTDWPYSPYHAKGIIRVICGRKNILFEVFQNKEGRTPPRAALSLLCL